MFKTLLSASLSIVCCLLFLSQPLNSIAARLKDNDEFYLKHLLQDRYDIDTAASAVVLYEKNLVTVEMVPHQGLMIREEVRRIIKILKKEGARQADVSLTEYNKDDYDADIRDIHGTTYSFANGGLGRQNMDSKAVQRSKSNNSVTYKFSLPAVKAGSVIEYSYTVVKDFKLLFCNWEFQGDLPKLYSELETNVPGMCSIVAVSQNLFPFVEFEDRKYDVYDNTPVAYKNYHYINGNEAVVNKWVRKNIAAATDEPYVANYKNYTEHLELQLKGFEGFAMTHAILDSWKQFNKTLYESEKFWGAMNRANSAASKLAHELAAGTSDSLQKARAIYKYVRDKVVAGESSGIFPSRSVNKVLEDKTGSATEINFLLLAMLKETGFEVYPLVISTTDQLRPLEAFPVLDRFNKTVGLLKLGGTDYYLDASDPYNPFGSLPADCYNGYARVVSKKGDFIFLDPSARKEKELVIINGELTPELKLSLNVRHFVGRRASAHYRSSCHSNSREIYKEVVAGCHKINAASRVSDFQAINLDDPDTGLVLKYVLEADFPKAASEVYLAPQFVRSFMENPFKSSARMFPVEMPSAEDVSYTLQLKLPDGWQAKDIPAPTVLVLDSSDKYKYYSEYDQDHNILRVNSRRQFNRALFEKEEYELIRIFFDKLIELEGANCIIKRS